MPTCQPVQCNQEDSTGDIRSVVSYGKRRRRRSTSSSQEDLLLVQSIQITDKFGFNNGSKQSVESEAVYLPTAGDQSFCFNTPALVVFGAAFFATQLLLIAAWTFIWQKKRADSKLNDGMSFNVSIPSGLNGGRTDSLCKLYDSGYNHSRRF